jgi:hypothetical protein
MTVKEHIDVLKELYYRGAASDDRRLSDRFFSRILYAIRNKLIKEKLDKGGSLSEEAYSVVCVDLINSPMHICNCADGACEYKRSAVKLANPLNSKKGNTITVMNLNGSVIDSYGIDVNQYQKFALNKKKDTAWFYFNNYIFIINNKDIKKVMVFSEQQKLATETCGGLNQPACVYPNSDGSFIPGDMEAIMYEMSLMLINKTPRIQDKLNDNTDSTEQNAEQIKR